MLGLLNQRDAEAQLITLKILLRLLERLEVKEVRARFIESHSSALTHTCCIFTGSILLADHHDGVPVTHKRQLPGGVL